MKMADEFKVYEQYLLGRHEGRYCCEEEKKKDSRSTLEITAWALGMNDKEKTYPDDSPHVPLRCMAEVLHEVKRLLDVL